MRLALMLLRYLTKSASEAAARTAYVGTDRYAESQPNRVKGNASHIFTRLALILLLAVAAHAEGPGYGVSTLTDQGCYTTQGPGRSVITLGRGWNNGDLAKPVTVYYTSHEASPEAQQYTEEIVAILRRLLPLVTLEKSTDVSAPFTVRIQSGPLPEYIFGQGNYPYSVEPVAGDVLVNNSLTGTRLWRVLAHEIGHAFGLMHSGWVPEWKSTIMLPKYTDGPRFYSSVDQQQWGWYYRITPLRTSR